MKFIFTADWHIKTKFKEVPLHWLADRYIETLHWLEDVRKEHDVDALVVGGDIFDKVPSVFDVALFVSLFHVTNFEEYVIYPGNHEMLNKKKSFYETIHKLLVPYDQVTLIYDEQDYWEDWQVIPYPIIKDITTPLSGKVMSHVRAASDRGLYAAEIDFSIFEQTKVTLLGDIHDHRHLSDIGNIWYPGAPYDTSFSTLPLRDKYVLIVDDDGTVSPLKRNDKFRRLVKVQTTKDEYLAVKEKVERSKHFYDIEIIVDSIDELRSVEDLKVKKTLSIDRENVLLQDADTEEDQIFQYLTGMLNMEEPEAIKTISVYKDL